MKTSKAFNIYIRLFGLKIYIRFGSGLNFELKRFNIWWCSLKILKIDSQVRVNFWQLKALKKCWKMLFISPWKFFSFWRYLNFCLDFFGHKWKRLDEKVKVNFRIYDAIYCNRNRNHRKLSENFQKVSRKTFMPKHILTNRPSTVKLHSIVNVCRQFSKKIQNRYLLFSHRTLPDKRIPNYDVCFSLLNQ